LTEKGTKAVEGVMPPVLEQSGGFGSDFPVVRVRHFAPEIDQLPQAVDDGSLVVLLILGG
jgi:hypothetical protein